MPDSGEDWLNDRQLEFSTQYREFLDFPFMEAVRALAEERAHDLEAALGQSARAGRVDAVRDGLLGIELKLMEEILSGDFFYRAYVRHNAKIRRLSEARARTRHLYDQAITPRRGVADET